MSSVLNDIALFHGSRVLVEQPRFGVGNPYSDYGLGFYCTESPDLASEWACAELQGGYVNGYLLKGKHLDVIDLSSPHYGTLHWLSLLLQHRRFDVNTPLMQQAKEFMAQAYQVDISSADVIVGHRADDSYFSFARAFLDNRIALSQLERALHLGNLGKQVVLKSEKSFEFISFIGAKSADGSVWHPRRCRRDYDARSAYMGMISEATVARDDVFMIDLIRQAG